MQQRLVALLAVAGLAGLATGGLLLAAGAADPGMERIPFQIATGSTAGAFFPIGEAIAGLISHPPGLNRCDTAPVCGPPGLIISARTSQGAVDNVTEVNNGDADSGLAQGDVIAAAAKGLPPFRGRASHLRVLASLYNEDIQLVVAARAKIKNPRDLRGKRFSLGDEGTGADITLREILRAYRVAESSLKLVRPQGMGEVALLQAGKLDGFLIVGDAPVSGLADLIASGKARLVPIEGAERDRLIKQVPSLMPAVIPAGHYAGQASVQTVATRAYWIVRDSVRDDLVFGIAKALFQPLNRAALAISDPSAGEIRLSDAALNLPVPLHPGAARFYKISKH